MSEDNIQAARMMIGAADTMRDAVRNIDDIMTRHQRFLDDWLARYEAMLEASMPPKHEPEPVTPPKEYSDDAWQQWHGGFPPVSGHLWVWVKQKNGYISRHQAKDVQWRHFKDYPDQNYIVAWQPAFPPPLRT